MIIPDLNLLLYAYNPHVGQHSRAKTWWENTLGQSELIGFPLEVSFGFVRISTNPKLGQASVPLDRARLVVESWLALPQARSLLPTADHFTHVMNLMENAMATGPILSDAILAAYAITHRATLCSSDTDFARFKGLDWVNPLVA